MIDMVFGLEELDQAYEIEFEQKCREVQGYYSKPAERCTLDGEWTESELQADNHLRKGQFKSYSSRIRH